MLGTKVAIGLNIGLGAGGFFGVLYFQIFQPQILYFIIPASLVWLVVQIGGLVILVRGIRDLFRLRRVPDFYAAEHRSTAQATADQPTTGQPPIGQSTIWQPTIGQPATRQPTTGQQIPGTSGGDVAAHLNFPPHVGEAGGTGHAARARHAVGSGQAADAGKGASVKPEDRMSPAAPHAFPLPPTASVPARAEITARQEPVGQKPAGQEPSLSPKYRPRRVHEVSGGNLWRRDSYATRGLAADLYTWLAYIFTGIYVIMAIMLIGSGTIWWKLLYWLVPFGLVVLWMWRFIIIEWIDLYRDFRYGNRKYPGTAAITSDGDGESAGPRTHQHLGMDWETYRKRKSEN